ncbi:flagellar filament 33 kDa core protein [mine drainage metagenome]|uniref:Flagellar filament 33 kDa core protein n=1 Tax=mine drainage metagenome TaxID=410659 RepID=A0A1J5Q5K7_9ZZZZ
MAVVINTNYAATIAANNLAYSTDMLQKSLNRLSSGMKIVSPSDDAGGLAVSMKLTAAATRSQAANTNIGNSVSYLQTQDGALQTVGDILSRMSELSTLYTDPTKNSSDLANYDSEFTQLQAELTAIAGETFNGVGLFGTNSFSTKVSEDGTQSVTLSAQNLSSSSAGVGALTASSVTSLSSINLTDITNAIQNVATMRATNGAEQSRLNFASDLLTTNETNLQAANSRIMDVDVAQESTQLARWNILVQSGTAMLSQANATPQSALKLLG